MKRWQAFIEEIEKAQVRLKFQEGEECFFRGHADSQWELLPTLLRHSKKAGLNKEQLRSLEADLFFEFQARARDLHQQGLSGWDVLQFMRHHGVATRLLDWTEVFGVALYFAVNSINQGAVPCIWLLNPYRLNEHEDSWELRDLVAPEYLGGKEEWDYSDFMTDFNDLDFGWDHPVALYPVQRNARLQAQRGYFTIHGDIVEPLDKINPKVVQQVKVPKEIFPDAEKFLSMAGINDYSMFPDLDGLARDLHRKNRI
jgi:hypothetical protein